MDSVFTILSSGILLKLRTVLRLLLLSYCQRSLICRDRTEREGGGGGGGGGGEKINARERASEREREGGRERE